MRRGCAARWCSYAHKPIPTIARFTPAEEFSGVGGFETEGYGGRITLSATHSVSVRQRAELCDLARSYCAASNRKLAENRLNNPE